MLCQAMIIGCLPIPVSNKLFSSVGNSDKIRKQKSPVYIELNPRVLGSNPWGRVDLECKFRRPMGCGSEPLGPYLCGPSWLFYLSWTHGFGFQDPWVRFGTHGMCFQLWLGWFLLKFNLFVLNKVVFFSICVCWEIGDVWFSVSELLRRDSSIVLSALIQEV